MDKNIFNVIEPDCEPLTGRDEADILAATLAKIGGAAAAGDGTGGATTAGDATAAADDATGNTATKGVVMSEAATEGRRIPGGRKRRSASAKSRGRRGGRIFAIAVAAVLTFGAVAFASTVIDPDSPLLTLFNPEGKPLTDDEVALAQAGGTVIDKSVEKNGMKVHVREAIGDKDSVYLLFDVTPPKGVVEPGAIYAFEHLDLDLKSSLFAGVSTGSSGNLSGELSEDGTVHFILSANANGGVQGKTFTLGLKNLLRAPGDDETAPATEEAWSSEASGASSSAEGSSISVANNEDGGVTVTDEEGNVLYTGDENGVSATEDANGVVITDSDGNILYADDSGGGTEAIAIDESEVYDPFETVVEGEWKVTFKLDYKDNSVALDADENVVIDGDSFRLNDVRISPLSLAYSLTHTDGQIDDTISIFDVLEEGLPVVVKMKDGTKYDMSEIASQGGAWHGDNRTYRRIMQFNRVTDPGQIESISLGDYVVKL